MNRKLTILLLLVPLISILVVQPAFAAKSYYAEFFDVQIDLQEGGSAVISETVKFHFEGDPFTFAFREISARETDGLTFLEASMDGVPMSEGTEAGKVEVEGGDPLRLTWHFPPTSEAAHVFMVRYRAEGVVRKGDADTLIWRAVPEEHEYSIERSTVTLTYPPTATRLEPPTLNRKFEAVADEHRVILTTSGLAEDEDLALTARFASGSLTQVAPQWQTKQEQANAAASACHPCRPGDRFRDPDPWWIGTLYLHPRPPARVDHQPGRSFCQPAIESLAGHHRETDKTTTYVHGRHIRPGSARSIGSTRRNRTLGNKESCVGPYGSLCCLGSF